MPGDVATTSVSGRVLDGSGPARPAAITVEAGRIADVVDGRAGGGELVAPGFVDLQVNGIDDVDCATAGPEDWSRADDLLAPTGVTAWLPTLVSRPLASYDRALASIEEARTRSGHRPAVLGAHLEGPFLGARHGAHRPDAIVPVDSGWLGRLPPTVRLVTIGPEQPAATEAIRSLAARGVVVSLGHSDADLETTLEAIDAGATMVTHLFNAMAALHHRRPGIAGAALSDDRVVAGLIADLVHVHPALLRTAFRAKGADGIALVTDSVGWRSGGMSERSAADVPRGDVAPGDHVTVVDGAPRLADGTIAGSSSTMDQAVRNVVDRAGVTPADAIRAASTTPARVLGDSTRGRIAPGARADLVVLDAGDLTVRRTIVGGVTVWEA